MLNDQIYEAESTDVNFHQSINIDQYCFNLKKCKTKNFVQNIYSVWKIIKWFHTVVFHVFYCLSQTGWTKNHNMTSSQ